MYDIIDAHQHFWEYNPVKHDWIDDEMALIRKDFLPSHLLPVLQKNKIEGTVAVQADQTENETNFLLKLAKENSFIKGIVGWVDLRADNIKERLAHYAQFNTVKGFRHVLQGQEPSFMLQSDFIRGIASLSAFNFTYDILIFPNQLTAAFQLVKQFPNQLFVIDHIAKPYIKAGLVEEWKRDMKMIAQFDNVYCKISGLVTEAKYHQWKKEDFTPYLDVVIDAFGINRIMYGSDWPVCRVAASYEQTMGIVKEYFFPFTTNEKALFFGKNTTQFYHL